MRKYDAVPGMQSHMYTRTDSQVFVSRTDDFTEPKEFDVRVRLAAVLTGSLCAFLLNSELLLGCVAVCLFVWLCIFKQAKTAVGFAFLYSLLLCANYVLPSNHAVGSLLMLANILRRMMLPAFFAIPLAKTPTGVLIASLNKLYLPKQATIALAVVFRFMPTVSMEYNAIRISQKFRGIGVSAWDLLRHPARSYETILVPLLIRTTRIADELSASAILRGATENGIVTSYHPIRFMRRDVVCLITLLLITTGLIAMDFVLR